MLRHTYTACLVPTLKCWQAYTRNQCIREYQQPPGCRYVSQQKCLTVPRNVCPLMTRSVSLEYLPATIKTTNISHFVLHSGHSSQCVLLKSTKLLCLSTEISPRAAAESLQSNNKCSLAPVDGQRKCSRLRTLYCLQLQR